jgi:hypothetical protein
MKIKIFRNLPALTSSIESSFDSWAVGKEIVQVTTAIDSTQFYILTVLYK